MSIITEKLIIKQLSNIIDNKEGKPITAFIPKVIIKDQKVFFNLEYPNLTTQEQINQKENIKMLCIEELSKIKEIQEIKIGITNSMVHKPQSKKKAIPHVKKIIVVASGKGGVGKSTIASNLAIACSKLGQKVALVDADIYGPSIPKMFAVNEKPELLDNKMIPVHKYGIKLMSMGFLINPDAAAVWRGPMITKALFQLIMMTNWAHDGYEVDTMIIDTPPGTGDIHLSLAENYIIDKAVLVTTPQEVALLDVRKCYDMFIKLNIEVAGIVENMSYFQDPDSGNITHIFGENKSKSFAKNLKTKILAEIPILSEISHATDIGEPFTFLDSTNKLPFINIAKSII